MCGKALIRSADCFEKPTQHYNIILHKLHGIQWKTMATWMVGKFRLKNLLSFVCANLNINDL